MNAPEGYRGFAEKLKAFTSQMSDAELAESMRIELAECDNEDAHARCDALISRQLRLLGFSEAADVYDKASEGFWYA